MMGTVTARVDGGFLMVKGAKSEEKVRVPANVTVKIEGDKLWVDDGTTWALAKNAVHGVSEGFVRILEIEGVGYRAVLEGKELVLYLGYAQPVRMKVPEGVAITVE